MSVPKKSYGTESFEQAIERLRRGKYVFVFVARCSVDDRKSIHSERPGRQFFQILAELRAKLLARPKSGIARHGIEILRVREAASSLVVVATNGNGADLAN